MFTFFQASANIVVVGQMWRSNVNCINPVDKIIKIIAEDFAFYLIADSEYVENDDGVLVDEVLQKMDIIIRKEFGRLASDYKQVNEQINSQSQEIKTIRSIEPCSSAT